MKLTFFLNTAEVITILWLKDLLTPEIEGEQ